MIATRTRPAIDLYVDAQLADERQRQRYLTLAERPGGYVLNGRPYVAVPCGCAAADCPGFAMVHDRLEDRAAFARLFGRAQP